jgi:uncharacterized protein YkwD
VTRAASHHDERYEPDRPYPDEPASPRRRGLAARLGPVGIAAIVAGVLIVFGVGTVAYSLVHSGGPAAPPQAQSEPQPIALDPSADPLLPSVDASDSYSATPSRSARPSASAGAVTGDPGQEAAVVALVNAERARSKCKQPLRTDDRLRNAARGHSVDMATHNFLNHTGSDRSSATQRMRQAGYPDPLSENLAQGTRSAREVVDAWLHSPANRRNILDCNAHAIGVGVAVTGAGQAYWTQDFGRS